VDVGAPATEHVRGDSRELLVDLGQDTRAGFEQQEVDLVAPDPGIKAQHVFDEGRELAKQLDTDEPPPITTIVRHPRRVADWEVASARSNCSMTWFLNTSASAIVLKVNAFDEPGISRSLVDAPSATTRWS
jgi:hypothetical protein